MNKESPLAPNTRKFLEKVGTYNSYAFKDSGKPTPEPVYNWFKILSMLEVCLAQANSQTIDRVNQIADWKQ